MAVPYHFQVPDDVAPFAEKLLAAAAELKTAETLLAAAAKLNTVDPSQMERKNKVQSMLPPVSRRLTC